MKQQQQFDNGYSSANSSTTIPRFQSTLATKWDMDYITRKAVYTGGMPQRQTMGILQKQIRLVRGNNEDNTLDGIEEGTKGAHHIIDDTN
jgi:hypothetical protein